MVNALLTHLWSMLVWLVVTIFDDEVSFEYLLVWLVVTIFDDEVSFEYSVNHINSDQENENLYIKIKL